MVRSRMALHCAHRTVVTLLHLYADALGGVDDPDRGPVDRAGNALDGVDDPDRGPIDRLSNVLEGTDDPNKADGACACTYVGARTLDEFGERAVVGVQTAAGFTEGKPQMLS